MGQNQTKKLLNDYGITDFSKTDYDLGGKVSLKVVGVGRKEIGLGRIFKGGPGSGNWEGPGDPRYARDFEPLLIVYHGTRRKILQKILNEGIVAQGKGSKKGDVWVVDNFGTASSYATDKYPDGVIFKVKMPESIMRPVGEEGSKANYYITKNQSTISPEHIVAYAIHGKNFNYESARDPQQWTWFDKNHQPISWDQGQSQSQSKNINNVIAYVPIGIEPEIEEEKEIKSITKAKKGGPGSGNFGHEGRPGEIGGSGEGGKRRKGNGIEMAPEGTERIEKYREEAKNRIEEWQKEGISDEKIIYDGYQWREWAHDRNNGWDWAMWEQIQGLANKNGFEYKKELTNEDIFNNPKISVHLLGNKFNSAIDDATTNYRNSNNKVNMQKFLNTEAGNAFTKLSQRTLRGKQKRPIFHRSSSS